MRVLLRERKKSFIERKKGLAVTMVELGGVGGGASFIWWREAMCGEAGVVTADQFIYLK